MPGAIRGRRDGLSDKLKQRNDPRGAEALHPVLRPETPPRSARQDCLCRLKKGAALPDRPSSYNR